MGRGAEQSVSFKVALLRTILKQEEKNEAHRVKRRESRIMVLSIKWDLNTNGGFPSLLTSTLGFSTELSRKETRWREKNVILEGRITNGDI